MITSVSLSNFRNFSQKDVTFSGGVTIIVGPNASGKTNILESLFLVATGKSFKANLESEIVRYKTDVARIKGTIRPNYISEDTLFLNDSAENQTDLEIILTRGEIKLADESIQKAPRKKLLVNGVARRLVDFAGKVTVVLFAPQDLELITESPSIRRKFIDTVLAQTDREYRRSLLSYEKGLRQRNKILWKIREEGVSKSQLLFWNHLLIKNGDFISQKREAFITFLNDQEQLNENRYSVIYDKSAISEARLEQYRMEEISSAATLVGPHRDDLIIKIKNENSFISEERELALYGSRGEQRMGVLWMKLSELSYIEKITSQKPILLLDDIFSELDHMHRDVVMRVIHNNQTIMTTADPHYVEGIQSAQILELNGY